MNTHSSATGNRGSVVWFVGAVSLVLGLFAFGFFWERPSSGGSNVDQFPGAALTADDVDEVNEYLDATASEPNTTLTVGSVGEADYQAALDAFALCMVTGFQAAPEAPAGATLEVAQDGWSADRFELSYRTVVSFEGLGLEESGESSELLDTVEVGCREDHIDGPEIAYQAALLSDPAYVDEVEASMAACLGSAGYDAPTAQAQQLVLVTEGMDSAVVECAGSHPSITTGPPRLLD